jgi:hypothetical protein
MNIKNIDANFGFATRAVHGGNEVDRARVVPDTVLALLGLICSIFRLTYFSKLGILFPYTSKEVGCNSPANP